MEMQMKRVTTSKQPERGCEGNKSLSIGKRRSGRRHLGSRGDDCKQAEQ
jgi:hypothetical protein